MSTVYTTLWLVSPIAPRWKNQAKAYDLILGKIKLEQDEFIAEITNDEEFGFMVSWVASHAVHEEYRNNFEKVREKYIELLKKIYITMLRPT